MRMLLRWFIYMEEMKGNNMGSTGRMFHEEMDKKDNIINELASALEYALPLLVPAGDTNIIYAIAAEKKARAALTSYYGEE